jgi:hypothetical protein
MGKKIMKKIKETKIKTDPMGEWKSQEQYNGVTINILHSDKISPSYEAKLRQILRNGKPLKKTKV